MSLNGVTGVTPPLLRPQEPARVRVDQESSVASSAGAAAATKAAPTTKPAGAALLAPRQEALPAEAPEGTDPELWQVLTSQERAYFARMTAMGPLTYGRGVQEPSTTPNGGGERPVLRGGRLDVRA